MSLFHNFYPFQFHLFCFFVFTFFGIFQTFSPFSCLISKFFYLYIHFIHFLDYQYSYFVNFPDFTSFLFFTFVCLFVFNSSRLSYVFSIELQLLFSNIFWFKEFHFILVYISFNSFWNIFPCLFCLHFIILFVFFIVSNSCKFSFLLTFCSFLLLLFYNLKIFILFMFLNSYFVDFSIFASSLF